MPQDIDQLLEITEMIEVLTQPYDIPCFELGCALRSSFAFFFLNSLDRSGLVTSHIKLITLKKQYNDDDPHEVDLSIQQVRNILYLTDLLSF